MLSRSVNVEPKQSEAKNEDKGAKRSFATKKFFLIMAFDAKPRFTPINNATIRLEKCVENLKLRSEASRQKDLFESSLFHQLKKSFSSYLSLVFFADLSFSRKK